MAIAMERHSGSHGLTFPRFHNVIEIIGNFMSGALAALFKDLQGLTYCAADPFNSIPLAHNALLAVVKCNVILSVQHSPNDLD
jgi:hypothetical protein